MQASKTASETWSQSLSGEQHVRNFATNENHSNDLPGCPSLTDSEVNKKVSAIFNYWKVVCNKSKRIVNQLCERCKKDFLN
jgi:hypothetical protein